MQVGGVRQLRPGLFRYINGYFTGAQSMKRTTKMMVTAVVALGSTFAAFTASAAPPDAATVTAAKTPADHEAIAKAYEDEAASFEKMAAMHKNLGETYTSQAGGKSVHAAQAKHCGSVATDLESAAKEERALAAEHHKLAKSAGK